MSALPSWTIAIPTYNGAAFLKETLRSVMAQCSQGFELIVCDDRSTDDSVKIVMEICGHRADLHLNETGVNLGLAGNWNRCVELASGEWVTILHQDDLLTPGFVENHRNMAVRNIGIGMVTGPAGFIDTDGNAIEWLDDPNEIVWPESEFALWGSNQMAKLLVKCNPLRCPATSFRRDLHQKLGGFDAKWNYVVDWDFWYRLSRQGDVAFLHERLAFQRWHQASETHRLARGTVDLEENEAMMNRILDENFNQKDERIVFEKAIRQRMARAWLARSYQASVVGDRRLELKSLRHAFKADSVRTLRALATSPRLAARLMLGSIFRAR